MSPRTPTRIVEAAYRWAANDVEWLSGVVEAAGPLSVGSGVIAYTVELEDAPRVSAVTGNAHGVPSVREALVRLTEGFEPQMARAMYAPTELVGNAGWR